MAYSLSELLFQEWHDDGEEDADLPRTTECP